MSTSETSESKNEQQIEWLVDRLALALMLQRLQFHYQTLTLPSREHNRESIRGDVDYPAMVKLVKDLLP